MSSVSGTPVTSITGIGLTQPGKFPNELVNYTPEELRPYDIDIQIIACGICGADPHFTRGDWGGPHFPIIPGHELVGYVVAKGADVADTDIKLGDRVGVGAQADSCSHCYRCTHSNENNCRNNVYTYGNHTSQPQRQGGYASHIRVNSKFAFKIPENIKSEHAAPLLCGGMTALAPLLSTGVKEGTSVAVVGIGGIGHMCIMFAKALGANVTAISSSESKKDLSLELGAEEFISMSEENYSEKHRDNFDVIVHTGSFITNKVINEMIDMLRPNGNLQLITGPDPSESKLELNVFQLIANNIKIGGISSGSPSQISYMLELASTNNIIPLIEEVEINEQNIEQAWKRLDHGDVKFRFVLTGYDQFFK